MAEAGPKQPQRGAFVTTLVAFCIAEAGDKAQIAILALAAGYSNFFAVVVVMCGSQGGNPIVANEFIEGFVVS